MVARLTDPIRACENCVYWNRSVAGEHVGQCRRYPPLDSKWPVVCKSEWCGEFKGEISYTQIDYTKNDA